MVRGIEKTILVFKIYYFVTVVIEILESLSVFYERDTIGEISKSISYFLHFKDIYAPVLAFYIEPIILLLVLIFWILFNSKTNLKIGRAFFVFLFISILKWIYLFLIMTAFAR